MSRPRIRLNYPLLAVLLVCAASWLLLLAWGASAIAKADQADQVKDPAARSPIDDRAIPLRRSR